MSIYKYLEYKINQVLIETEAVTEKYKLQVELVMERRELYPSFIIIIYYHSYKKK